MHVFTVWHSVQQELHVINTFSTHSSFAKLRSAVMLLAFGFIASVAAPQLGKCEQLRFCLQIHLAEHLTRPQVCNRMDAYLL